MSPRAGKGSSHDELEIAGRGEEREEGQTERVWKMYLTLEKKRENTEKIE